MRKEFRGWSSLLAGGVGFFFLMPSAMAATKVHVIGFGKWTSVQVQDAGEAEKRSTIKIRALVVDGRVKEFVAGTPHEVTDRLFVARRAFRVNDSLPKDTVPRWQWQFGGWILVDRLTGRVSAMNLPEFDPELSSASWYRDYVAYCGRADDSKKTYVIVAQLGRRKPLLKREIAENETDSACPAPEWQRGPVRVSFEAGGGAKQTFAIRGQAVDVVDDAEDEE